MSRVHVDGLVRSSHQARLSGSFVEKLRTSDVALQNYGSFVGSVVVGLLGLPVRG